MITDAQLAALLRDEQQLQGRHLRLLSVLPPAGLAVADAADALGLSSAWVGRLATVLVARGLVLRVDSHEDRRIVYLTPTKEGLGLASRISKVRRARKGRAA